MMFFQILLVAGYAYSHLLRAVLSPKKAFWTHCVVLVASCLTLPVTPQVATDGNLTIAILWTLAFAVGLPYFALSTTGSLVQAWHHASLSIASQNDQQADSKTYRLYAISNFGSLLALVSYPFLVEPWISVNGQIWIWSLAFVVFCSLCLWTGFFSTRISDWGDRQNTTLEPTEADRVTALRLLFWFLLAFCPSVTLLATTNLMCQEIASVPFLWILPLSLYLLSFMICFDRPGVYNRAVFGPLLLLSIVAGILVVQAHIYVSIVLQVGGLASVCFFVAMTCHGELERLKPSPERLTLFFLIIAIGGACGGVAVAVGAPMLFDSFIEFQLALLLCLALAIACPWLFKRDMPVDDSKPANKIGLTTYAVGGMLIAAMVLASLMFQLSPEFRPHEIFRGRNEYGVIKVIQSAGYRKFISGQVNHGGQFVDAEKHSTPSGYYGPTSGFGVAMRRASEMKRDKSEGPPAEGLRVAVIGMGVGAMLAWSQPEDDFTMFELNPLVHEIAKKHFTYLDDHPSAVYIGDGRRWLNKLSGLDGYSSDQQFDVIAMDAFSSDSVPQHLLTKECFELYFTNLAPDGIIVAHITNRFVDLRPVVIAAAEDAGMAVWMRHDKDSTNDHETDWILISRDPDFADVAWMENLATPIPKDLPRVRWTDSFASLSSVTRWSTELDIDDLKKSQQALKETER